MIKGPTDILVWIFAFLCFSVSIVLLPWSELGFNGHFPPWLAWAFDPIGLAAFFNSIPGATAIEDLLKQQGAKDNFGNYAYALFMFAALILGAIAIVLIGREDAEEKTILPLKK